MSAENITSFDSLVDQTEFATIYNGKTLLNFDLANETTYSLWDTEGYSVFIFEVNLLVGI